jgi:predicted small metal-binding protein
VNQNESGQYMSTITIQPGEKLYYIEGCSNEAFCNSNDRVGKRIAEFAKSHNMTKIEIQYDKNELATGAYVIYTE